MTTTYTFPNGQTDTLPALPLDSRFTWAKDQSTGRLHIQNAGRAMCNARFRVYTIDALAEGDIATDNGCSMCIGTAISEPPPFARREA